MEKMRSLITAFPEQLKHAWEIAQSTPVDLNGWTPSNVLILGMGGSGISGSIASKMLAEVSPVPIVANNDYTIPAWTGDETLVVACSYSGNTEETLAALDAAVKAGARIVAITSGGKLGALCDAHGWPSVRIPGGSHRALSSGWPLLRSCTFCTPRDWFRKPFTEPLGPLRNT